MTASGPSTPLLHKNDLADLDHSGLSVDMIAAMGCHSLEKMKIRELTGVKVSCGGYAIPYPGLLDQTGRPYLRIRLREPRDGMKYVSGKGDDPQLYIPSGLKDLPKADLLVVTEGEKKAAKAVQGGIHCVAIQGVWSWCCPDDRAIEKTEGDRVSEDTAPLPALVCLAHQYKRVLVLGDSDLISNPQGRRGFELLAKSLSRQGIRTGVSFCPPAIVREGSETMIRKQGLDDWLITHRFLAARSLPAIFRAAEVNRDGITDSYNAMEFKELFQKQLAYSQGQWWYWKAPIWVGDTCEIRRTLMPKVADVYLSDADRLRTLLSNTTSPLSGMKGNQIPPEIIAWCSPISSAIKSLSDSARSICNLRGIDAALTLAKPLLKVADDEWNKDAYLLAVQNGVVDLRSGELLPSLPEQRITRSAGATYDPHAVPTLFLKFLEQVQPDPQIRDYIQRLAGYSAMGRSNEQKFFAFVGSGANGKSTYMGLMMDALGGYAVKGPLSLLAEQSPDRPRNDLAALAGARMVSISETPENLRIDEATVKAVTGQDVISARFLNREFFQYRPCFTPILDTNHAPRPRDPGEGIWRRLIIVPWPVMIPAEQRDRDLREKLLEELPGILAWIIAGAKKYFAESLPTPPKIFERSQVLRTECDDVARWLEDCVEQGPQFRIQSTTLYQSFRSWNLSEGNTYTISQKAFSQRLGERAFTSYKSHGVTTWLGIRLREHKKDPTSAELSEQVHIEEAPPTDVTAGPLVDGAPMITAGPVPTQADLMRMAGGGLVI